MAELLNTKINGTLNVNDYFNIDENGNLTLNSGNNEIFKVGNDGLNLTGNLTVKNGTAFLSTIDTIDDNGVVNVQKPMNITGTLTTSGLITANGGLNVNSGNFNSNVKLIVNDNITANSLNIKNGDNDILAVENDNVKIDRPLAVNGDVNISPNSTGILVNKVFDSVMNFDKIIKNSTEYVNDTIENFDTKNSYLLNLTSNDNFTLEYLINENRLNQVKINNQIYNVNFAKAYIVKFKDIMLGFFDNLKTAYLTVTETGILFDNTMAKIFELSGSYIRLKNGIISDMYNNYYIFSPCINRYIKISDFIEHGIELTKNGTYKFFNDNSENNYIILKGNFNNSYFYFDIYSDTNSKYIMLFEDNDYEYDITNKPTIYISLNDNSLIKIPDILAIGSCTTNLYNNSLLFEREDYNNDNRLTINGNLTVNGNTNINYGSKNVLEIGSSIIDVNSFINLNGITKINGRSLYIDSECRTIDISKTESTTDKITIDRNILIGNVATPTLTQYGSSYFNSDVQIGGLVVNGSKKTANLKVYGSIYASDTTVNQADYAEYFEWEDSNHNNEDRVGYFVSITSDRKIQIANTSSHILGIVSATPAVIGNGAELEWNKKYLTDEWGRPIYEAVIIPVKYDESGKEIEPERTEKRLKLNPDYDENIKYIPRSERPEWTVVGMLGMLRVRDDGSCKVGGYCKVNENGIATASESGYYVTKRFTDNIIEVFFK